MPIIIKYKHFHFLRRAGNEFFTLDFKVIVPGDRDTCNLLLYVSSDSFKTCCQSNN